MLAWSKTNMMSKVEDPFLVLVLVLQVCAWSIRGMERLW